MKPDTIFALSSGRLPAAIAVVRISGPRAGDALVALAGRLPAPRQAMLARLRAPPGAGHRELSASSEPADGGRVSDGWQSGKGSRTSEDCPGDKGELRGEAIDDALVLWFPGPASETGEDTAELQLHGGRAVVSAVFAALGALPGLRPAEAGEFTRRAFLNGKLDLTRVEGLADLIGAETEAQRRQAFRQLKGLLGDRAEIWRKQATEALALIEAAIDFPDEDVPQDLMTPALAIAAALRREIVGMLGDGRRGERLRDGLTVAVAGPVNVGKSSIVNRLAKRPAAIVSPYAGTTRDVIEVHLDLAGYPVTVLDTAGLRDADDPVEQEGMRRARARAAEADLVLWVVDATAPQAAPVEPNGIATPETLDLVPGSDETETDHMKRRVDLSTSSFRGATRSGLPDLVASPESITTAGAYSPRAVVTDSGLSAVGRRPTASPRNDTKHVSSFENVALGGPTATEIARDVLSRTDFGPMTWYVINKCDLVDRYSANPLHLTGAGPKGGDSSLSSPLARPSFRISAETGEGFDTLIDALAGFAGEFFTGGEAPVITRERHRHALQSCADALGRALAEAKPGREDIVAEELRLAATALGRLTGRIDVEDVLDVIFRDFCIGK